MNRITLLLSIIVSFVVITSFTNSQDKKTVTVAWYNVENLFDTLDDPKTEDSEFLPTGKLNWDSKRYQDKLEKLSSVIAQLGDSDGPEILGLCEIENKLVLEDLVKTPKLKKMNYGIAHVESPDFRGIDVALIYKKKSFTVSDIKNIEVVLPGDQPLTRDVLVVSGMLAKKNKVHIILNHWPSRRGGEGESEEKRETAAKKTREAIDAILSTDKQAKIIAMGDFNDEPTNSSVINILKAKETPDYTKGDLLNLMYPLTVQGLGTYNYQSKWNMLDQFMVSEGVVSGQGAVYVNGSVQVYSPEYLKQQEPEKYKGSPLRTFAGTKYLGGYSDHFAIYFQLTVK